MFYYVEVHLLDHYTQLIKMHGETVKLISRPVLEYFKIPNNVSVVKKKLNNSFLRNVSYMAARLHGVT
jgi:hypothetical protein